MKRSRSLMKEGASSDTNDSKQHAENEKGKSKNKNKMNNATKPMKLSKVKAHDNLKDSKAPADSKGTPSLKDAKALKKILKGQKFTKAGSSVTHTAAQGIQCGVCLQTFHITAS